MGGGGMGGPMGGHPGMSGGGMPGGMGGGMPPMDPSMMHQAPPSGFPAPSSASQSHPVSGGVSGGGSASDSNPEGSRLFVVVLGKNLPEYVLHDVFAQFGGLEYIKLTQGKNYGYVKVRRHTTRSPPHTLHILFACVYSIRVFLCVVVFASLVLHCLLCTIRYALPEWSRDQPRHTPQGGHRGTTRPRWQCS